MTTDTKRKEKHWGAQKKFGQQKIRKTTNTSQRFRVNSSMLESWGLSRYENIQ